MNKLNILLVEDNVSFALDIEMILDELGYGVAGIVDNGKEALQIIKESKPDLIISDLSLKGEMTGIDLINAVKGLSIAVIFITQYRDDHFYEQAKKLKPVAYLVKPFDKLTLRSCIDTAFSGMLINSENAEETTLSESFSFEDFFYVKHNGILTKIRVCDISSVQSDGNYCDIILKENKKYAIKISLVNLIKLLPSPQFIRIHQRHAVQSQLIEKIDAVDNRVFISNQYLPIGKTYRSLIMKQIRKL